MTTDKTLTSSRSAEGQTVQAWLDRLAQSVWPGLNALPSRERASAVGEVLAVLYSLPIAAVGVLWLVLSTDVALLRQQAPTIGLLFILIIVLQQVSFSFYAEIEPGSLATFSGSLDSIVSWSAALILGPSGLWLALVAQVWEFARQWSRTTSSVRRWALVRDLLLSSIAATLVALLALRLYQGWGGALPLPGLAFGDMALAVLATLLWWVLGELFWLPLIAYWATAETFGSERGPLLRLVGLFLSWPLLVVPFAVLAAGLYVEHGVGIYLFYVAGLLLISLVARQLGTVAERSQQRSREMELLERLGRALISAPPDASTLPQVLAAHVPAMFPHGRTEVRLFPGRTLLHSPDYWEDVDESVWEWAHTAREATYFLPGAALPWGADPARRTQVVVPLQPRPESEPVGAIYLALPEAGVGPVVSLLPAVSALAAQVCTTLSRAESHAHELAYQKVTQELTLAGTIQASFLPTDLPDIQGWQLAVTLVPALQTTGDFFDWITLPDGKLGIVIADVVDKGLGAALFMALSRTLIRTYAIEHPDRPDLVLAATNRRILQDSNRAMFVTIFYGVLDPQQGTLTYCNGGHSAPYWLRLGETALQSLPTTGMPLGILPDLAWSYETIHFAPGDLLFLYTDGLPDAQNEADAFFGIERVAEIAQAHRCHSAQELQQALLNSVYAWMGDAPQFDDLTLLILGRHNLE